MVTRPLCSPANKWHLNQKIEKGASGILAPVKSCSLPKGEQNRSKETAAVLFVFCLPFWVCFFAGLPHTLQSPSCVASTAHLFPVKPSFWFHSPFQSHNVLRSCRLPVLWVSTAHWLHKTSWQPAEMTSLGAGDGWEERFQVPGVQHLCQSKYREYRQYFSLF